MQSKIVRKPKWLRKKMTQSSLREVEYLIAKGRLHTVCQEALCPNIGECFSNKQATFLILGNQCTRQCTFCNISKNTPLPPDPDEPEHVAGTVMQMGLRHVVITSPTRDDLADGGAEHFAKIVHAIKTVDDTIAVELLIPDMKENETALATVAASGAKIIGHNVETVPRLYHIRKGATYERSLRVLKKLSALNPSMATKSGIMLGFGEQEDEVLKLMQDLLDMECRLLSIGQYLSPSRKHEEVVEFVKPERFDYFRDKGMAMGFRHIKSSPYTRSSYMAHEYLEAK
ncbi:MAG: lipoyl synthase [Campylobacterota bacterium]|nr:lipoyl synthase [Campylobacterota bacterium]